MIKHIPIRHAVVAAGGVSIALAAVGVAVAAIPGPNGTVTGCYARSGGQLRVIDAEAGRVCTRQENTLTWSQRGPIGPTGPAGAAGPKATPVRRATPARRATPPDDPPGRHRAPGPHGQNGATTVLVRQKTVSVPPGGFSGDQMSCQPGESATGGGGSFSSENGNLATSLPLVTFDASGNAIPFGWEAYARNHDNVARSLIISVICASP